MSPFRCLVALAAVGVVTGCATRADLERLRRDQDKMRANIADMQVSIDTVNRRLDTMRTSIEDKGGGGTALKTIERRLAELEARLAQPPMPEAGAQPPGEGSRPAPAVKGTEAAAIAMRREERVVPSVGSETYRRALQLHRDGQGDQAIQQFREFVRANPKSDLADNAQYWIGEIYYGRGDYNRAIIELNEVLLKYPQGDQVPGALLALATAFANSGDKIDARLILQKLISDHPKSEEAEIGRQQLKTLTE